jgi:3D (Asp-Asp-Asp) domain-containing protein
MDMSMYWGPSLTVDSGHLSGLAADNHRLRRMRDVLKLLVGVLAVSAFAAGATAYWQTGRLERLSKELRVQRRSATRSSVALAALARTHDDVVSASEQINAIGTKSWGRRFTVTMYTPRSEKYGKFNTGMTSTLTKADPSRRIVAVDPKLIPYGSWVWIEKMGWFRAEDCGSAIKGFRLDLLTATEKQAMTFGKQDRFVIVVPAAA